MVLFCFILIGCAPSQPAQDTTNQPAEQSGTSQEGPPGPSVEAESQAQQAVEIFSQNQKPFVDLYNNFENEISGISNGTIDAVTGYSDLESMNAQALNIYNNVTAMNVPKQYSASQESLELSVSYLQNAINETKDYMDDQKISHLANAKDDLQQAYNGNNIVSMAVLKQAMADGYTP